MTYWLIIGPVQNLELGLNKSIWGISEHYVNQWNRVKTDDKLVFYSMNPIKGIIGWGTIISTARELNPFWSQEVKEGQVLWPLRIHFHVGYSIPRNKWETEKIPLPPLSEGITIQRAFQVLKEQTANKILKQFPPVKK